MTLAETRKAFVQETYDREAERYRTASHTQQFNLSRLLSLAVSAIRQLKPKRILDVGCGLGPAVAALSERGLLHDADYLGIDLSPRMIAIAKDTYRSENVRFTVGDAEALQVADASVDLVLSNVALHWLNQPKLGTTPKKAFAEIYRVLRPGGLVAVSTTAIGKAQRFLNVYHSVMACYSNSSGFNSSQYVDDPIGRLQLHELVDLALNEDFKVELGELYYQPMTFSSAQDYLVSARAYGFNAFMAPLAPDLQEAVWSEITERFVETVGAGAYLHDFYINYLIARKPSAQR
jgi:malonyl-CoA O-methyltransferase